MRVNFCSLKFIFWAIFLNKKSVSPKILRYPFRRDKLESVWFIRSYKRFYRSKLFLNHFHNQVLKLLFETDLDLSYWETYLQKQCIFHMCDCNGSRLVFRSDSGSKSLHFCITNPACSCRNYWSASHNPNDNLEKIYLSYSSKTVTVLNNNKNRGQSFTIYTN